jgi:hypothetical protein
MIRDHGLKGSWIWHMEWSVPFIMYDDDVMTLIIIGMPYGRNGCVISFQQVQSLQPTHFFAIQLLLLHMIPFPFYTLHSVEKVYYYTLLEMSSTETKVVSHVSFIS